MSSTGTGWHCHTKPKRSAHEALAFSMCCCTKVTLVSPTKHLSHHRIIMWRVESPSHSNGPFLSITELTFHQLKAQVSSKIGWWPHALARELRNSCLEQANWWREFSRRRLGAEKGHAKGEYHQQWQCQYRVPLNQVQPWTFLDFCQPKSSPDPSRPMRYKEVIRQIKVYYWKVYSTYCSVAACSMPGLLHAAKAVDLIRLGHWLQTPAVMSGAWHRIDRMIFKSRYRTRGRDEGDGSPLSDFSDCREPCWLNQQKVSLFVGFWRKLGAASTDLLRVWL